MNNKKGFAAHCSKAFRMFDLESDLLETKQEIFLTQAFVPLRGPKAWALCEFRTFYSFTSHVHDE